MVLAADAQLRLDANWVDYVLIALYFVFVLGIGILAQALGVQQHRLLPVGPRRCPPG